MEIKVHTRDMGLSPRLETYIKEKVDRLDRYLANITEANLELHKEGRSNQPVVQLTIRHERGLIFRVEEKKQDDFFAAIDVVVDRMYRQLERYKTKKRPKGKERWIEAEAEANDLMPLDEDNLLEEDLKVVRRKEITLQPMDENEAIEQLEMLGHDFFVYLDGESGKINVLYKRRDGNYGLLGTGGA
jgi:putative sigma-54 modulation protein